MKKKKKLLYFIGGGLCAIGLVLTILLICLCCRKVTIGKNYTYSLGDLGESYTVEVTAKFIDENMVEYDAFVGNESKTTTTRYKISSGGILFVKVDGDDWSKFGTINAFEINLDTSSSDAQGSNIELKLKMECKSAKAARVAYIVCLSISFVAGAGCIIAQIMINNKDKNKQNIEPETLD